MYVTFKVCSSASHLCRTNPGFYGPQAPGAVAYCTEEAASILLHASTAANE